MRSKIPNNIDERGRRATRQLYAALDRARLALRALDEARAELDRAADAAAATDKLRVVTVPEGQADE